VATEEVASFETDTSWESNKSTTTVDEDDDDFSYFEKLANEN
jgi:hypothetical protein